MQQLQDRPNWSRPGSDHLPLGLSWIWLDLVGLAGGFRWTWLDQGRLRATPERLAPEGAARPQFRRRRLHVAP
jgi:hypothetical protein